MALVQGDVERQLPIVRRGYDPYEVQRLMGALSNEMRALAATNMELKQRLARAERPLHAVPQPPNSPELDQARRYAAELLAAAEREGNTIRQRARLDADRIVELAQQRATDIEHQHDLVAQQLKVAQEQIVQLVRLLESRSP
jgi:cell division septum initiation protein DivIVA